MWYVAIQPSDRTTRCNSSWAPWRRCWRPVATRRTPSCLGWPGRGTRGPRPAPPCPQPADSLARTTCGGVGSGGRGGGGRCPSRRTCRGPETWAWSSWRSGRGWWRQWPEHSLGCWGSVACNSGTPGDGGQCQTLAHTWTRTNIWKTNEVQSSNTNFTSNNSIFTWAMVQVLPVHRDHCQTPPDTVTEITLELEDSSGTRYGHRHLVIVRVSTSFRCVDNGNTLMAS